MTDFFIALHQIYPQRNYTYRSCPHANVMLHGEKLHPVIHTSTTHPSL